MPEINEKIAEKLKEHPEIIQILAKYAVEQAKRISGAALTELLERKVKQLIRRNGNN